MRTLEQQNRDAIYAEWRKAMDDYEAWMFRRSRRERFVAWLRSALHIR